MSEMLDVLVLASGRGSNLRAIVDSAQTGSCRVRVRAVVSDRPAAPALEFARERGIETAVLPLQKGDDRADWDRRLAELVADFAPRFVVLAGFMRIVGKPLLARFPRRILNVHPSLLPAFSGLDAPAQAIAAGVRISGCTVHLVDEGVDTGPVLAQTAVPILPTDDAASLHARIQIEEHRLLPRVLDWIARGVLALEPSVAFGPGADVNAAGALVSPDLRIRTG